MKPLEPLTLMDEWTPAQRLAVYDFCRLTSEMLWQNHRDSLLEEMMRSDRNHGYEHHRDVNEYNLELPFDHEPPF